MPAPGTSSATCSPRGRSRQARRLRDASASSRSTRAHSSTICPPPKIRCLYGRQALLSLQRDQATVRVLRERGLERWTPSVLQGVLAPIPARPPLGATRRRRPREATLDQVVSE